MVGVFLFINDVFAHLKKGSISLTTEALPVTWEFGATIIHILHLRGGTRKVGEQERNRRKKQERGQGKKHEVETGKSDAAIFSLKI